MNKKAKKKNNQIAYFLLVVIAIVGGFFLAINNLGTSQIEKENMEFITSLPQLQGKNLNEVACFDFSEDDKGSYIDCFIPNKFNAYVQGIEDLDRLKVNLKGAFLIDGITESVENLSEFDNFFNSIQPTITGEENENYLPTKRELEEKIESGNYKGFDLEKYTYLQSLEGNYENAAKYREKLCKEFPSECKKEIDYTIRGEISDEQGNKISKAKVELLGTNYQTKTKEDGTFELKTTTYNHEKIRIKASKDGYSTGVLSITVMSNNKEQSRTIKITLEKSQKYVRINTVNNSVEGEGTTVKDNNYVITTDWSTYQIPFGAIVHKNGEKYKGGLTAYLFEFNKNSRNENLLENDIFDEVAGYAGNLMKTFGMPYILFVSDSGETLHILKSNPMTLTYTLPEMEALKTNQDKIYSEVTQEDLQFLVDKSKELGGYPIDRFFLVKYNILRFPAFWVFDQTKGTWTNQPFRLIKTDGTLQVEFYTISQKQK